MIVDWQPCEQDLLPEETYYDIEAFVFGPLERFTFGDCVLLVHEHEFWVEFALFRWACSDTEGRSFYEMIMKGSGSGGALRECRHMDWGTNGYVFYMPLDATARALVALRRWFD